jgi:hypothetical protein
VIGRGFGQAVGPSAAPWRELRTDAV